jgi:NADPH2:quinone reductase
MRAWILPKIESIDALRQADLPDPRPAAGEVVLDVQFAALNPADRYLAEGQYPARPALPAVLGRDGVGTVSAVGDRVGNWKVGDTALVLRSEIGVNRHGTFATKVAVPVESLAHPPADWSAEESAGAALVYLTAWQAITQWADLPRAARVLVTGASGGVGVAAIHLAKAAGHTVIAMSRGTAKTDTLRQFGADSVLDPTDTQWRKKIGAKVDLVIDNIGGELLGEILDVLGHGGRVSLVGRLAGAVPQFNAAKMFFNRAKLGGVFVGDYSPLESQSAWRDLVATLDRAGRRPVVDHVFGFDDLPEAFERLKEGPVGKVLLRVGGVA